MYNNILAPPKNHVPPIGSKFERFDRGGGVHTIYAEVEATDEFMRMSTPQADKYIKDTLVKKLVEAIMENTDLVTLESFEHPPNPMQYNPRKLFRLTIQIIKNR